MVFSFKRWQHKNEMNKNRKLGDAGGKYIIYKQKVVYECRHGHHHDKEIMCGA
jgi:hypothetical protein